VSCVVCKGNAPLFRFRTTYGSGPKKIRSHVVSAVHTVMRKSESHIIKINLIQVLEVIWWKIISMTGRNIHKDPTFSKQRKWVVL